MNEKYYFNISGLRLRFKIFYFKYLVLHIETFLKTLKAAIYGRRLRYYHVKNITSVAIRVKHKIRQNPQANLYFIGAEKAKSSYKIIIYYQKGTFCVYNHFFTLQKCNDRNMLLFSEAAKAQFCRFEMADQLGSQPYILSQFKLYKALFIQAYSVVYKAFVLLYLLFLHSAPTK